MRRNNKKIDRQRADTFYAEEPDNSIGSNFNVTPRTNHDMSSDVCLSWTKVFITINGEKGLR